MLFVDSVVTTGVVVVVVGATVVEGAVVGVGVFPDCGADKGVQLPDGL